MADIQFTDNYVRMLRNQGNPNIHAWRTPGGEVYYGATPRSSLPTDTSVARVSEVADVTTAPQDATIAAPAAAASRASTMARPSGDGRDSSGLRSGGGKGGDIMDLFKSDDPTTVAGLLAEHEQYGLDQEQIQKTKDFFTTPIGRAAMTIAPGLSAVGAALTAGPATVRSYFKEKGSEGRLRDYESTINDLMGNEALSNDDFWDQAEAAMSRYDAANTGRAPAVAETFGKTSGDSIRAGSASTAAANERAAAAREGRTPDNWATGGGSGSTSGGDGGDSGGYDSSASEKGGGGGYGR